MEDSTQSKEIGRIAIEYVNTTGEVDTFDSYLEENVDFTVTVSKQKFPTYTAYNISYEVSVGDVRVSSVTIMPRKKEKENGKI